MLGFALYLLVLVLLSLVLLFMSRISFITLCILSCKICIRDMECGALELSIKCLASTKAVAASVEGWEGERLQDLGADVRFRSRPSRVGWALQQWGATCSDLRAVKHETLETTPDFYVHRVACSRGPSLSLTMTVTAQVTKER